MLFLKICSLLRGSRTHGTKLLQRRLSDLLSRVDHDRVFRSGLMLDLTRRLLRLVCIEGTDRLDTRRVELVCLADILVLLD